MALKRTIPPAAEPAPESWNPRLASAWAALTYALCALALAYPALSGQFLVNANSDQYKAGYAFREFAATYMKQTGGFPQWNPYLLGGMPYVAAMHGDIFYPTFLLRLVMPVDVAMTWGMILHFFLCGLATFWFLRKAARVAFFGSLIGGTAYMMGGFVSSLLSAGHDGKLFVSALLPVMLLVVTWGVRDGKRWAWGLLALVVGLTVLTPHPQLLQYVLLCSAAWALFLAFSGEGREALSRPIALRRLGLAFGAVVLGLMIGAIQYLPVREYVAWSPRGPGFSYESASQFSFPIEELINTYLPQFSGILDGYWGRSQFHFHSEYVGAAVLVLASAAFGILRGGPQKRFLWFWTGTAIVTLLWAVGEYTPFFRLIYALVPGTKFFRAPSTIFFITTFAVAVMAALGTERLLAGRLTTRFAYGWLAASGVLTLLALAGGLTALGENLAGGFTPSPEFNAQRVDLALANAAAVRIGAIRSFLFAGLACAGILALARRLVRPKTMGWALVSLVAIDLWTIERNYWEFSPPAAVLYQKDAAIDFVRKVTQPVRVLTLGFQGRPMNPYDPFLRRDALMVHRVRITLGYHGNSLGRYDQLRTVESENDQVLNPTFWALTNTEFLLANSDTMPLIPGATRVVGPIRNAAGTSVSLFLLPGEHPFAWVTPALAKYPDPAVLDALHASNFPVRSVALFDTSSALAALPLTSLPAPLTISTTVTAYEPGHFALTLSAPAPKGSVLVVSENYYPGWRATVDGKPTNVERVDFVLMGVPLTEGATRMEFTFSSGSYAHGKIVTIVALVIAVLAALGGVLMGRTRAVIPRDA
jgi:hypothetical protein